MLFSRGNNPVRGARAAGDLVDAYCSLADIIRALAASVSKTKRCWVDSWQLSCEGRELILTGTDRYRGKEIRIPIQYGETYVPAHDRRPLYQELGKDGRRYVLGRKGD